MFVNLIYAFVPYLAVGLGLLVFHNAWAAILTYHAGILAVILFLKPGIPFRQKVQSSNRKWLMLSVAIGACGGVVLYLLWPLLSVPPDITVYIRSIGLTPVSWPFFIAYYVLVNPCLEEYFWRGCLGSKAKRPILNDFLFAGYHLVVLAGSLAVLWLPVVLLVLAGAAWYWRQISRITGGLLAAILSHMAADVTVILAIYYLTSAK
jgi:membrane protease YdiL (CAAX protease family)